MKVELEAIIRTFSEFVAWEEYDIIPITLGAAIANLGEGDSIFLFIVGPPSSGKTEWIRGFYGLEHFFDLSKVTPHTFISGYIQAGGKKKKGELSEKSLLIRLKKNNQRIVMIKDFTSILSDRVENKSEVFSQLREIADGYCSMPFGTGEDVRWTGKLGFIAGVTGAIDESFSMRQVLGERFLQVRISKLDTEKVAEKSALYSGLEEACRDTIQKSVKAFMDKVDPTALPLIEIDPEIYNKLFQAACLLSLARTGVRRDNYSKSLLNFPEPEGPGRLIRQLVHLGKGISLCLDKPFVDEEVYKYLKRIVKDSIPAVRERCISRIWNDELAGGSKQTTTALAESLGHQNRTIYAWLEDLKDVGLLTKQKQDQTSLWSLSPEGFLLIQQSEIYGCENESMEEEINYFEEGENYDGR